MNPMGLAGAVMGGAALAQGAYWTALSLAALPRHKPHSTDGGPMRLAVLVPAHNEEASIAATVRSLAEAGRDSCARIVVIADNCTDSTASVAREAGANVVLERQSETERGKSYALAHAIDWLRDDPPDGVCVVDADTEVSPNFFAVVSAALQQGAAAAQVHYRAAAGGSQLGALRRLAFLLVHWSRPLGASRLGLGTSLKGNGMAFRWDVVAEGLTGSGVTEDAALTLDLARRGVAVTFAPDAWVEGLMASTYEAARTQDERWEGGRLALTRRALGAAVAAVRRGKFRAVSSALEVAQLPLSLAGLLAVGGGVLLFVSGAGVVVAVLPAASLAAYVATGLAAARVSLGELAALREAPRFAAHKLGVYAQLVRRGGPGEWKRTAR